MHALSSSILKWGTLALLGSAGLSCDGGVSELRDDEPIIRDIEPPTWLSETFVVVERGPRHATVEWAVALDDVAVSHYELTLDTPTRAHKIRGTTFLLTSLPSGSDIAATVVAVDSSGNRSLRPLRLNFRTMPECEVRRPALPAKVVR